MKFSDIIGHEQVKNRLRAMVDADRMPHALLLQGPEGVGKMMLARAAAQYIHCSAREGGEPCGRCPACVQHESFNHVDTVYSFPYIKRAGTSASTVADDYLPQWRTMLTEHPYMDFAEWQRALGNPDGRPEIMVDESASLIRKLSFTSHAARYKVAIIWLPEKMREDTANKLLKLIEEPHDDTLLIMVSNSPGDILPTIYSRVQRIDVKRLGDADVARYLETHAGLEPMEAMSVAHIAQGNINEAIKQVALGGEREEHLERFKALMRLAYSKDVKGLKAWSEKVADMKREKVKRFLDYCSRQVRENFVYNLNVDDLTHLNREESDFSARFARFVNERNVVQIVQELEQALRDVAGNAAARITLFDLAVRMIILIRA